MKKYLYLALLPIFALVLAGCNLPKEGALDITESGGTKETKKGQPTGEAPKESFIGTLKEVISFGGAVECTYKKDDAFFGKTWVKGKQIYSEFTQEGKKGYMIMKDNCMWTWDTQQTQGVKMCFDPSEFEEMTEGESSTGQQMGPPSDMNYNCIPAVIGDSRFNPPTDIDFMDFENMAQPEMQRTILKS